MDFEKAKKQLDEGNKIRRKSWPKDMYMKVIFYEHIKKIKMFHKESRFFSYDLTIIDSEDWIIIGDDSNKLFLFIDILPFLKLGKLAKLKDWPDTTYIMVDNGNIIRFQEEEHNFVPTYLCFIANDWEVV